VFSIYQPGRQVTFYDVKVWHFHLSFITMITQESFSHFTDDITHGAVKNVILKMLPRKPNNAFFVFLLYICRCQQHETRLRLHANCPILVFDFNEMSVVVREFRSLQ
jgi:hypothetical protein